MIRISLQNDIHPLSEFRSKVSQYLKHVNKTKRPMVITQNGKSAAVFMDIGEYESLLDKLDLLQEIETAEKELNEGKGISQSSAKKMLLGRVRK